MNYLVTYAILITALAFLWRDQRRRFEREAARAAERHARRDYDAIDALIRATREKPHESYAWGPVDCGCTTLSACPACMAEIDSLAEGSDR